ncbi:MAG: hypothetical protein ACOYNZ_03730, partial [Rhodoferax sp.]
MNRIWTKLRMTLFVILAALAVGMPQFSAHGQAQLDSGAEVLARVEVKGSIQTIGLPVYAHLLDAAGNDYALVIASANQLAGSGLSYQILDDPASSGTYYLARERRNGARQTAATLFNILHDDGRRILVKGGPELAGKLSELGFDINAIPKTPMILRRPFDRGLDPSQKDTSRTRQSSTTSAFPVTQDPRVAAMMDQVQQTALYDETGNLSGENAITISGSPYTISTRHTSSGTPIQKATHYVYERIGA